MNKVIKTFLVLMVVSVFSVGSALAVDQDQKRDRKRDGSCRDGYTAPRETTNVLAADQKRDRKRDGSCRDGYTAPREMKNILAADRERKRDRKRNGSCRLG